MVTQYKWNRSTWFTGTSEGTTMRQATQSTTAEAANKSEQSHQKERKVTKSKKRGSRGTQEVTGLFRLWEATPPPPSELLMETQDFGHSMGSQEDNKHYFLVSWDLTSLSLLATCTGLGEGGMKGAVQLLHPTGKNWRSAGFFSGRSSMDFSPQDSRIGNTKPVSGVQDTRHCFLLS